MYWIDWSSNHSIQQHLWHTGASRSDELGLPVDQSELLATAVEVVRTVTLGSSRDATVSAEQLDGSCPTRGCPFPTISLRPSSRWPVGSWPVWPPPVDASVACSGQEWVGAAITPWEC
jgi:hypothetical protein